jgi:hypothetical protein
MLMCVFFLFFLLLYANIDIFTGKWRTFRC